MKKILIYMCVILAGSLFIVNNIQAQERSELVKTKDIAMQEGSQDGLAIDSKRNAEEKALILKAGEDNPAKAEAVTVDQKLSTEEQALFLKAGTDNPAKAQKVTEDTKGPVSDKEIIQQPKNGKADISENSQPPGETPSKITNYREINGPNTQPQGEQPGTIINYRNSKGDNTQPEGIKPEKR